MEDLITGAFSFAQYLRIQLCKKQNQMFNKNIYHHKIWGAQIKGGQEVCDAIMLENQNNPFISVEDIEHRYTNLIIQFNKALQDFEDLDLNRSFTDYATLRTFRIFGNQNKLKIKASYFEEDIQKAVLRGSLKICMDFISQYKQHPTSNPQVLLGDVHIVRKNLHNTYYANRRNVKKVEVYDTMKVNPIHITPKGVII